MAQGRARSTIEYDDANRQNGSVILSGPFYVYDPDHPGHENWEEMMHTDILNFTGGDKSKVRGGMSDGMG